MPDLRAFVRSCFAIVGLMALSCLWSVDQAKADDRLELLKSISQSDWQAVSEAVTDHITNSMADSIPTELEQRMFKDVVKSSQSVLNMAIAIKDEDFNGLGSLSANLIAGEMEGFIDTRFGEDSTLKRVFSMVKANPELSKALVKAALDADPYAAAAAIDKSLDDIAKAFVAKLDEAGRANAKRMLKAVVPDHALTGGYVFSPVDLYLQAVSDWSDYVEKTRTDVNDTALNCVWMSYVFQRENGMTQDVAEEYIADFGTGPSQNVGFNCKAELQRRGVAAQVEGNIFTRRFSSFFRATAALGQLGLDSEQLAQLVVRFDNEQGFQQSGQTFANWMRGEFMDHANDGTYRMRKAIEAETANYAKIQVRLAQSVLDVVYDEMQRRGLLEKDDKKKGDDEKGKGDTKGDDPDDDACEDKTLVSSEDCKNDEPGKDEPEEPMVWPACDALYIALPQDHVIRNQARDYERGALDAELQKVLTAAEQDGNCDPDIIAKAREALAKIRFVDGLVNSVNQAMVRCGLESLDLQKARLQSYPEYDWLRQISEIETALRVMEIFERARDKYKNNDLAGARADLEETGKRLAVLKPGQCTAMPGRIKEGLDRITQLEAIQNKIGLAISTCNIHQLEQMIARYADADHVYFAGAVDRMKEELENCKKDGENAETRLICDGITAEINEASANYKTLQFKTARSMLENAQRLMGEAEQQVCPENLRRIKLGLAKIATIQAYNDQLNRAIAACDLDHMQRLANKAGGETHEYYHRAHQKLSKARKACKSKEEDKKNEESTCSKFEAQLNTAREAYQASKFNQARGQLNKIVQQLGGKDPVECGRVLKSAQRLLSNIERFATAAGQLRAALSSCDIARLDELASSFESANHPWFGRARAKALEGRDKCQEKEDQKSSNCAKLSSISGAVSASLRAGEFADALDKILPATALVKDPDTLKGCEDMATKVASARGALSSIIRIEQQVQTAAQACDMSALGALNQKLTSHRLAKYSKAGGVIARARRNCAEGEDGEGEEGTGTNPTLPPSGEPGDITGKWHAVAVINLPELGEYETPFVFDVHQGRLTGVTQFEDSEEQITLNGQADGDAVEFGGSITFETIVIKLVMQGSSPDPGQMAGKGYLQLPELNCLFASWFDEDDASNGGRCPNAQYPLTWDADRVGE